MKTIQIETIAEFSREIESLWNTSNDKEIIYRGHGAVSFELKPRAGRLRPPINSGREKINEGLMLELFRRQSLSYVATTKDDWELLAIAQHHGMATRLLDWTRNPLVALYFAVRNETESRYSNGIPKEENAEVIAWRSPKLDLTKPLPAAPFKIQKALKYVPRITTPRLRVQSGLFTAHSNPKEKFQPHGIVRIKIPHGVREKLKKSLHRHGINESVLFPDIDSLAKHIDWLQTKSY